MDKYFYRYEWREYASFGYDDNYNYYSFPNPKIELTRFKLVKETEKGYWITYDNFFSSYKKWIPKESRKRFAYPTKKEALNNLIKRTEKRISILNRQLECCKLVVTRSKNIKEDE